MPAAPPTHHIIAVVVLLAIPLGVGIVAGAASVFGPGEEETKLREARGGIKRALCWIGLIGALPSACSTSSSSRNAY